jgi:hypothetical protein
MSSLESTSQHVARRLELITNWLALIALLGIGIVWGPSVDDGAGTPDAPGASLQARAQAPPARRSSSDRPQQGAAAPPRLRTALSAAAITAGR